MSSQGESSGGRPTTSAGAAINHAEQRPGRQQHPVCHPGREWFEPERTHPGFAAPVALTVTYQQRAAAFVKIGLSQRQSLRDPQAAAPQNRYQRPSNTIESLDMSGSSRGLAARPVRAAAPRPSLIRLAPTGKTHVRGLLLRAVARRGPEVFPTQITA